MTTRDEREGPAAGESDVFLQHLTQGGELLAAGHTEEALGYLESALSLNPGDEKAQNLLGLCCFKLGHLDRAAEIYEHLVRENPVDPTLRVNLGLVYLKANAVQRAVREFETATELAPDHRKAHNYLGLALAQAAEYGRAREHFLLAGSEHMAEKMARALDGAGFEPVTTPAGGVAALDVASGAPLQGAPGDTPSPELGFTQGQPHWDPAGDSQADVPGEGWTSGNPWDQVQGSEGTWDAQGSWDEAGAGAAGWPHPDEGAGWAHPDASTGEAWQQDAAAGHQPYTGGSEEGAWQQDAAAGHQVYTEGSDEGVWQQDMGAGSQSFAEASEDGSWPADADAEHPASLEVPENGAWPQDTGADVQPDAELSEDGSGSGDAGAALQPGAEVVDDGGWAQEADPALQPYGGAPEGGPWEAGETGAEVHPGEAGVDTWPQDAGAGLQPQVQPQEGEVWPQDDGLALPPTSPHPPAAGDATHTARMPPEPEHVADTTVELTEEGDAGALQTSDAQEAQATSHDGSGGDVDLGAYQEVTSALDDDLSGAPAGAGAGDTGAESTEVPGEKVASLRPARLEDSWGAQFGLEDEGRERSEPAEELVVELNASEFAEPEVEEAPAVSAEAEAPPTSRRKATAAGTAGAGTQAPREVRSAGRDEAPAPGPQRTAAPTWEERPAARSSGSGWLVELSRQLVLRAGPSTEGVTELGDGVVDLQLRDGMRTRTHGYFALEGKVRLVPEPRRIRGRSTDQHFGPTGRELMRVHGSGHLMARVPGRQLLALELGEEGLYLREEAVYAFEENVMFENGSLSDPDGNEVLNLVHLRGTGRLLVELEGALRTVQIREGAPSRIELSRIVGWFGELVPQAVAADIGLAAHLELSGQGFALIDAAHRGATP